MKVFTVYDLMKRYHSMFDLINSQYISPPNDFDKKPVYVTHKEFHHLCTEDSRIFDTLKVHGISIIIISEGDY